MAINGCLTLAWLEEDDPSRGFFRVRPAALIAPESKVYVHDGEYGDEDFPRGILQADMECRPCSVFGNKPCRYGDYRCLYAVTPAMIAERVAEMVGE